MMHVRLFPEAVDRWEPSMKAGVRSMIALRLHKLAPPEMLDDVILAGIAMHGRPTFAAPHHDHAERYLATLNL